MIKVKELTYCLEFNKNKPHNKSTTKYQVFFFCFVITLVPDNLMREINEIYHSLIATHHPVNT